MTLRPEELDIPPFVRKPSREQELENRLVPVRSNPLTTSGAHVERGPMPAAQEIRQVGRRQPKMRSELLHSAIKVGSGDEWKVRGVRPDVVPDRRVARAES